jgi:aryl-alcohol dehydrogenase-like predicted oxidoreductase
VAKLRSLGSSGLLTPPLILGGNVFGWTADEQTSFRIMDAFLAAGGTMIDTADTYSAWAPGNRGGESETVIGNWLARRGRRDDVLIATKVGFVGGLSAANIERALDASLRRLGTDYVDLYYAHKDDQETPFEETLEAFDRMVRAGKVRALGASQIEAPRLEQALETSAANGWTPIRCCRPGTASSSARASRRRWRRSRKGAGWASRLSTASPTAISPASIAAGRTCRRAFEPIGWRNIWTATVPISLPPWMPWRRS